MNTSTLTRPRAPMPTLSPCGPHLTMCSCSVGMPRTAAQLQALHQASVQRARLAGWHSPQLLGAVLGDWWSGR